jgi:hypothetical protein
MRSSLQAGGARKGEYRRAVEIYHQIHPDPSSDVLQRLALPVALELLSPYVFFGEDKKYVNPLQRYVHYEQAYLSGELDPNFSEFNVWKMRQIVNSDVTEEELEMRNTKSFEYRPDLAYSNNPQWR